MHKPLMLSLLLFGLTAGCGSDPVPGGGAPPGRAGGRDNPSGAASGAAEQPDLEAMLAPVQEYQGQGRNLFAYGQERRTAPPPRPAAPPTPVRRPPTPAPVRPTPAPSTASSGARVNVKYAGFLEKTDAAGEKSKFAIFLDGNEILAGAVGDTLANRFTIVEIGLESVTVSAKGSTAEQRIPLQAN